MKTRVWECHGGHINDNGMLDDMDGKPGGHCARCGMYVHVRQVYLLLPV